jgi:hypothetical protein
MRALFIRFLFGFLIVVVATTFAQNPSGNWLDSQPKPWNRSGLMLPHAPDVDQDEISPMCKPLPHRIGTLEERALTTRGWLVFTSVDDGHGIRVVGASASLDGMCRPDQYQDFVFVDGKFAGTLSPILMGARSDGGAVKISFPGPDNILVEFDRYTSSDPLCCPSRISEATYEVRRQTGQPTVILTGVRTRPT